MMILHTTAEDIKCHENCPDTKPEIVYIQYDENMKFIYVCSCRRDCHSTYGDLLIIYIVTYYY